MLTRVWNVVRKEILQFARDRMLSAFLLLMPILQLVLLARATGSRITGMGVAILDLDRSPVTRQMIADLDNREELNVEYFVADESQLQSLLDRGEVDVGVIFPRGLEAKLLNPARTANVSVIVDGSNSMVGAIALIEASAALSSYGLDVLESRGVDVTPDVNLRLTTYYNPTYDMRYFSIPAQVGFIIYQITLSVASLGLTRERELGTLEQLIVTPLGRLELVIGKAIPALLVGVLNFVLMTAIAVYGFHIPMRGSFLFLFVATLLFVTAEIGWGMLISTIARTQQQAILFVFILSMVDISLSGYMVPVRNLPRALSVIARLTPMYHYLVVIRSVMLKGAAMASLWVHAVALAFLGIGTFAIAIRGVSQSLD